MKRQHLTTLLLLAGCLPSLAACGGTPADDAAREAERATATLGVELEEVEREVRQELATGNIDFGGDRDGGHDGEGAEITPEGDLLIDGKPVAIDADERALLLAYRRQVADIAIAGARIGLQGAKLATTAMGEAFRGVLSGNTEEMEARIEAEAEKIEARALEICDHLAPMLETQRQLAASIPELAPYATMTQDDVDDCRTRDGGVDIDLADGSVN